MWRRELRPHVCCECLLKAPLSISECWRLEELGTQGSWPVFGSVCARMHLCIPLCTHQDLCVPLCDPLWVLLCAGTWGHGQRGSGLFLQSWEAFPG